MTDPVYGGLDPMQTWALILVVTLGLYAFASALFAGLNGLNAQWRDAETRRAVHRARLDVAVKVHGRPQ